MDDVMYLEFYGLLKEPFHITPDPEFLYLSPSHKEALGVILFGVENRAGFMMITGGVGLGKTTILRSALQQFDRERVKTVLVFNPCLSYRDLVRLIYEELGLDVPEGEDQFQLIQRLHLALIEEYKKGNNVVLVIDEAQNMPVETLENLRMLSNLETSKDKLLQIILVGQQPELENLLNTEALRQLKQRIAHRATLIKLTPKESADYIRHRLDIALGVKSGPLSKQAINKIVSHCDGVPRCINIICSNALVSGYGSGQNPIGPKLVQEVIDDLEGRVGTSWRKWAWAPAALVLVAALLYLFMTGRILSQRVAVGPATAPQKALEAASPTAQPPNAEKKSVASTAPEGRPAKDVKEGAERSGAATKAPMSTDAPVAAPAAAPVATPSSRGPAAAEEPSRPSAASTSATADRVEAREPPPAPQPQPQAAQATEIPPPSEKPPATRESTPPRTDAASAPASQGAAGDARPAPRSEPAQAPPLPPQPVATAPEKPPAAKPESPAPAATAASPAAKGKPSEKKEAPDPGDLIDWLIDKRARQRGAGSN
jgi:general secretion pathway protein A